MDIMMARTLSVAGVRQTRRWRVKYPTRARTLPMKLGWDLGVVPDGYEFNSSWTWLGWVSITSRKWIPATSVEEAPQVMIPPVAFIPDPSWKYAIVKHDPNRANAHKQNKFVPDTITLQNSPVGSLKGRTIPIYLPWWVYIKAINDEPGYKYARSIGAMWINAGYDQDAQNPNPAPKAECIMGGGNYIAYTEETKTHVKLVSQSYMTDTSQLNYLVHNWRNIPYMYWYPVAINKDGNMCRVGSGYDVFFPLIHFDELWIEKWKIEKFPEGKNYRFYGLNIFDGETPLMTVDSTGTRTFHTDWKIETPGILPPTSWK